MTKGEWHREFYLNSPMGENELRDALSHPEHGAKNRADVRQRLEEMKKIPEDRCHITRDQRRYLERVLADFPD